MSATDNTALSKSALSFIREMAGDADPITTTTVAVPGFDKQIPLAAVFRGEGNGHELVNLRRLADEWRDAPERRKGVANTLTLDSFIDLVERHKDENSVVFANLLNQSDPSITAVIDYHTTASNDEGHKPRFGEHRVIHKFPLSVEWRQWQAKSGQEMGQAAFADWLEDHLAELVNADDSDKALYEEALALEFGTSREIMQLSRNLTLHIASKVVNAPRLQSGTGQIQFEEEHQDGSGKPVKVPGLFMLAIPLFFGGNPIRVPVRLRYRLERKDGDAKVMWTFILHRPQQIVYEALKSCLLTVEMATGLPIYEGAPEA